MKIESLSQQTRSTLAELAAKRGVPVDRVIDRFYSIFRRSRMSRHPSGGAKPESGTDNYIPYFS